MDTEQLWDMFIHQGTLIKSEHTDTELQTLRDYYYSLFNHYPPEDNMEIANE